MMWNIFFPKSKIGKEEGTQIYEEYIEKKKKEVCGRKIGAIKIDLY